MPPRSPLPQRLGLDAAWLRTNDGDRSAPPAWATMREWLHYRLPENVEVDTFLDTGRFVYANGEAVRGEDGYRSNTFIWFHRDLPVETPVPGKIRVIHRDERIVVIDKPPFLSSIPRGRHVRESVVVRMREELGLPELSPMHRLDRVTSGVLMLATEQRWRAPYQTMFMRGEVQKVYRALAGIREDLVLPTVVRNHLIKERGIMNAEIVPGVEPNSESLVELESEITPGPDGARRGIYKLSPRTGKTHQLRMHLWSLGIPIAGDPLYPVAQDVAVDDFSTPLQLLAHTLSFSDPIDGTERHFESTRPFPLTAETDAR
ncbi:pseudouridylate synthase [Mycetocola lacteus]|uniref:RNA pseudouridylate synthase n=1 Tax=Mycetocola lacteus TaxID=76637 RepID=A0A3L7ATV1_9MICO|nr:pseudouridine synthase [Mycetocola lacteus]RLP83943.1 pseudouridylate synthase [Mycetocola lacteus]